MTDRPDFTRRLLEVIPANGRVPLRLAVHLAALPTKKVQWEVEALRERGLLVPEPEQWLEFTDSGRQFRAAFLATAPAVASDSPPLERKHRE